MIKTIQDQTYNIQMSEALRRISRLEALLNGVPIVTAKIADAAITNAKINDLTWDKARGGTAILGGLANVDGILSVRDASDVEKVLLNKDGITISDGKIILKNSSATTIIDAYGLVSLASFVNTGTANSFIYTTSGSFVEVSGAAMSFTNVRSAVFLLMLNCQVRMSESVGNTGNGMISIFVDGVEQSNGINIATGVNNYICQSLQLIRELAAGSHTITVKGRCQTIYAGAPEFRADAVQFSYIRFGV